MIYSLTSTDKFETEQKNDIAFKNGSNIFMENKDSSIISWEKTFYIFLNSSVVIVNKTLNGDSL